MGISFTARLSQRIRQLASIVAILAVLAGCSARTARYIVIPSKPHYLLRYPDGKTRAFPDTTASLSNAFEGWIDLGSGMTLTLERTYFEPPESRRIQDYIGLETIQFRAETTGGPLRQIEYRPLESRPRDEPSLRSAIPGGQLVCRYHRLFFQTVVDKESGPARAVLVSASSQSESVALSKDLIRGLGCETSLRPGLYCSAIPNGTTASVFFDVIVNGKATSVAWGSTVAQLVGAKRPIRVWRKNRSRMAPVIFESADPEALRLPLLPGDVLIFGR